MNLKKAEKTTTFLAVLVIIAAFSSVLISYVYTLTKPKIENIKKEAMINAAKNVLPIADEINLKDNFFEAIKDGEIVGYAFKTESNSGYNGFIEILMGIDSECKITGFEIMQHGETPGLGDQAKKDFFKKQFISKSLSTFNFKVKQDGGNVDAITAATITSRAVTGALKQGLEKFEYCRGK
jgi:electron transport complex protein RnfG